MATDAREWYDETGASSKLSPPYEEARDRAGPEAGAACWPLVETFRKTGVPRGAAAGATEPMDRTTDDAADGGPRPPVTEERGVWDGAAAAGAAGGVPPSSSS